MWTTLGDLFSLQAGKNIAAKEIYPEFSEIYKYPCFGGNGIRGFVSNFNRNGDFPIIGRQGALCGNVNLAIGDFYATEHAVVVERFSDTDLMWTYYVLIALNLNQYATATAQPGLAVNVINDVIVPVPPFQEQCRISKAVTCLFSLINEIEHGKQKLQGTIKQTKSKVLDLAIHGKLVPQDVNDEPANELLKRINPKAEIITDNGHYQKLPVGWCLTKVKDAFIINPKNKENDDIEAGFVPMANISDGFSNHFSFETKKWETIKSGFTHFSDGDIAVAKISPCLENRKSMVLSNLPNGIGAGTTELHVFRPLCVTQLYGLYFFKSNYFINKCIGTFNGVVGQQRVGKNIVECIDFPLPPLAEQQRIVAKIEEIFQQLDMIETAL